MRWVWIGLTWAWVPSRQPCRDQHVREIPLTCKEHSNLQVCLHSRFPLLSLAHTFLAGPRIDESPFDQLFFQRDPWLGSPLNISWPSLSPSTSTIFPLNASPSIEISLPAVHAGIGNADTFPSYTSKSESQLPPTCFLQMSYDRLHASVVEAISQDAKSRPEIHLPNKESLNTFIETYFESFSPLFPILSPTSFVADTDNYLLVLCISTIGASFLAEMELQTLYAMRSLLQKCLDSLVSFTESFII